MKDADVGAGGLQRIGKTEKQHHLLAQQRLRNEPKKGNFELLSLCVQNFVFVGLCNAFTLLLQYPSSNIPANILNITELNKKKYTCKKK